MYTSFSCIFLQVYLIHINVDIKIIQEKDKNDNEYLKINIKKEGKEMHTFELKIDGDDIEEVLEKIKVIKEKYPDTLINVKMNYIKNFKRRSLKKTPQNKNFK